jgi:glycosyltransferase involved in cell wall biosynthesis
MRLLYFTDNNSVHNRRFLKKLASSGHEVFYLSLAGTPAEGWAPREVQIVSATKSFARNTPPKAFESFVPEFGSIVKELRPDLVQAGAIQSCAYIAARAGVHPLLAMSWGSDILVDAERDREWKDATVTALNGADGLFCDCDTVRERARLISPGVVKDVVQFPWGLERGIFSPQGERVELPWPRNHPVFISTRAWEPGYGFEVLLEAFAMALTRMPELRLLLIGHGSRESEVRNFVENRAVAGRILICTDTAGIDMSKYFRSANAYISCTPSDGSSISLLEAMATGLPSIVADNPSNREWLSEGVNGWFGKIGSRDSYAEKILEVAALSPMSRESAARLSMDTVRERADWDKNFPLLLQAYDKLTSGER